MRYQTTSVDLTNLISTYFKLLPRNGHFVKFFIFATFAISVAGQPIQQPPERFACGPVHLNITCDRWGYDTCITDNGESYCLPCSEDYLASLCGTKEQIQGCNLYCTEKAVNKEAKKLNANFTEQLEYLNTQNSESKKEVADLRERIKILETHMRNKHIALYAIGTVLCLVLLILVVFLIWCLRQKGCKAKPEPKTSVRDPSVREPEQLFPLLTQEFNDPTHSEETVLKEPCELLVSLDETAGKQDTPRAASTEKDKSCIENGHPVTNIYSNMPATNTKGNNRLAINNPDHSFAKNHV